MGTVQAAFAVTVFLVITLAPSDALIVSGFNTGLKELDEELSSCLSLKDAITDSVTAAAISFYADHPRNNRTFEPDRVEPFSPSGLFFHYYGKDASPAELQKAILQLAYSAADATDVPTDRDTSRRNLYSYVSAGSREHARKKAGELLHGIINEYVKERATWQQYLCVDMDVLDFVMEAIEVEFYRIRNEVGDVKFAQFLSLGVGSTLAFAIDDTGSMSGEIAAAKRRAQELVKFTRGTLDAPQDFVLVPFNDPEVGPVTVTNDAEEYHAALGKLYAHGGGDAPELCMRGIQLAIENSRPGSIIYVITDNDAKDFALQDTVLAQARQKSIVVTFLLTSRIRDCSDIRGNKRCMALYQHIARQTGGKVLVISRSDIFRATDIVQSYAKQGLTLLQKVTIISDSSEAQSLDFVVDSTIQEVLLESQGSCEGIKVHGPKRKSVTLREQRYGDVWTGHARVNSNALHGIWSISLRVPTKNCTLKIQAKTTMGFALTMFSKGKDEPEDAFKVLENYPFVEDVVAMTLDAYGFRGPLKQDSHGDRVTAVNFVTETGEVLESVDFSGVKDATTFSHVFKEGISQMKPFQVMATGVDANGLPFQRMQPRLLTSSYVHIDCDLSKIIFRAGVESQANVTIYNYGPDDEFIVTTSDEYDASSFHDSQKKKKITIASKQKVTKTLHLTVGSKSRDGTAIKITITAKGRNDGSFQYSFCTLVVGQKRRPRIDAFSIQATVNARLAETVVTSLVTNNADIGREAEFDILLPEDAFITGITIKLPNETIHGVIEEKKKAKKVYEEAKAVGTVAGHVAARESSTRAFRTSMFAEPRQSVEFILTYQQLLKRVGGKYEYAVILNPDQPIHRLTVDVHISEEDRLLFVRVPPIRTTQANVIAEGPPPGTSITRSHHDMSAHVHYEPDVEMQTKWSPHGLSGTFVIEYDVMRPELFGQVTVDNGYFAHFFAPPDLPPTPKIVVFVVDTSGSMYGYKMKQMKVALTSVLRGLKPEDRFNLVLFGDKAEPWIKNLMTPAVPSSVEDAIAFVKDTLPRGGTNVLSALDVAVSLLEPYLTPLETIEETSGSGEGEPSEGTQPPRILEPIDQESDFMLVETKPETAMEKLTKEVAALESDMENYAKMIVFMTDGRPSVGETDANSITDTVTKKNQDRFSLHALGFGSLVDFKFLTKLAASNGGISRQIFEGINADAQIRSFLDEVTNPILRDVSLEYPTERVQHLTTNTFTTFMAGTELVVAGQVRLGAQKEEIDIDMFGEGDLDADIERGPRLINAQIRGRSFDNEIDIDFDIDPSKKSKIKESAHQIKNFTEKLWAFLRLKGILLEATLEKNKTKKEEINERALNMSLKYEFVTPLTSLVVLRSEERIAIEKQLREEEEKKRKEEEERIARIKEEESVILGAEEDFAEEDGFMLTSLPYPAPKHPESGRLAFDRHRHPLITRPRAKYSGRGGGRGGGGGGGFSGDPHFVVPINPDLKICFNWDGKEGEIYNLLFDPERDLTVNGVLVNAPAPLLSNRLWRTYVSVLTINLPKLHKKLLITPWNMTLIEKGAANATLSATSNFTIVSGDGFEITSTNVTRTTSVLIVVCQGLRFSVTLHRGRRSIHQRDHLDFNVDGGLNDVSRLSDGVFGQFARLVNFGDHATKVEVIESDPAIHKGIVEQKAQMYIRGEFIPVVKHRIQMPGTHELDSCWFVHRNGAGVMHQPRQKFKLSSVFDIPLTK